MFFKLLIFSIIFLQTKAQNYCDQQLCPPGRRHIACNNNGQFPQGCSGRLINIQPHINLILQLHNERRNQVAGGNLSPYPTAVRMATMTWDPELARIAVFNVVRCRTERDDCHNTNKFRNAGQNIGNLFGRLGTDYLIRDRIDAWFNEHFANNSSDIDRFTVDVRNFRPVGFFTTMVNEKNTHVGCAISEYPFIRDTQISYLVCNYAVTSIVNQPVYRSGTTASQCRTGRNPMFSNLCSSNEAY